MFSFKLGVRFIDDEETTFSTDEFAVFVSRSSRFKRANNFHDRNLV